MRNGVSLACKGGADGARNVGASRGSRPGIEDGVCGREGRNVGVDVMKVDTE